MNNGTISDRCRNIRQQLTDLLAVLVLENESAPVLTTATPSSVKDVLERFILWAGNLGALRKSTSKLSLDSRLAGSSDLRDYICAELEDMSEALEDLSNIVNGSLPNREIGYGSGSENDLDMGFDESSSYSDNPVDEAGSILQVISQGITSLLKVGILVRQPASSGTDRFHRASRDSTNAFLDRFDIDYVRHKHPKLGDGEQSSRMGRAIAKRRQFIRYCRDHKHNLAAEEEEDKAGSQKATTAKQSSKATTFVAKENLMDILQGSADILGEEEDAVSLCSVSTTSESLAVLKLPRLADLSPEDDPFECPICYTLQQFSSEQAWRRHAYRDLKAYVCTVGGTECDDKFFEDRASWFDHELEQHRSEYVCVLCGTNDVQEKRRRGELRQHILGAHGDFEFDQLERLEDAGRETITSFKTNDCPFCDDWSKLMANRKPPGRESQLGDSFYVSISRFKKHVAMHLEQLAIFAVPRHEFVTGMEEDESQDSDTREKEMIRASSVHSVYSHASTTPLMSEDERFALRTSDGSIAHVGSEIEMSPTTASRKKLNPEIEELEQQLGEVQDTISMAGSVSSLESELDPIKEKVKRQEKVAESLIEAQKRARRVEVQAAREAAREAAAREAALETESHNLEKEPAEFKPEPKAGEEIRTRAEGESANILPLWSSTALQSPKESALPVANSEEKAPGSIEVKNNSDSPEKDNEDQQQGLGQPVGTSPHPPAEGEPAASLNSRQDMTTNEPAGANNAEIDMTSFFGSTDEENRVSERILKGKGKVVAVSSGVGITNVRKDDLDEKREEEEERRRIKSITSLQPKRIVPSTNKYGRAIPRMAHTNGNHRRKEGSPVPLSRIRRNSSGI